jgi:hypothetical protein
MLLNYLELLIAEDFRQQMHEKTYRVPLKQELRIHEVLNTKLNSSPIL